MEKKSIEVHLTKIESRDTLIFNVEKPIYIDMNSDDQSYLRDIFYELLLEIYEKEVDLKLIVDPDYSDQFYKEVAEEYIKHLNAEIKKIQDDIAEKFDN
jgi:predicted transcriptional regulator